MLENKPLFVDYFLRHYFNPLETVEFVNHRKQGKFFYYR